MYCADAIGIIKSGCITMRFDIWWITYNMRTLEEER